MSSLPSNGPSRPPRHLLIRSVFLTISCLLVVLLLLFVWYSDTHPTYSFLELLESSRPIGLGVVIGMLVSWLVYPKNYCPKYFDEFFPQADWVFLWYMFLGPLAVVIFSGWSLFELHHLWKSPDSPLTTNFYHVENVAILIYLVFFFALGFSVKTQLANSSDPPSHS